MPEDQELISKIKKGDNQAFKLLFQRYYPGLYNFGMSLLHDEEEVRNLIQDIFLQLWEKKNKLDISSAKSYLFTTLNNKSLNIIRHLKIVHSYQKDQESTDSQFIKESDAHNPFIREAIDKAIKQLPPKAQQCFLLTQVEGKSIKEAAKILEISDKTVENQLSRSRKILQKKLKSFR